MQRLLVRNAGLPKPSKCRPILESLVISAPVAAQYFIPKWEFVVSIVPMQINTVQQNNGKKMCITKNEIVRVDEESDKKVYVLYGLTEEEIKIVEGKE